MVVVVAIVAAVSRNANSWSNILVCTYRSQNSRLHENRHRDLGEREKAMDAGIRFGELLEYEEGETKRWKEWFAAHPEVWAVDRRKKKDAGPPDETPLGPQTSGDGPALQYANGFLAEEHPALSPELSGPRDLLRHDLLP